MPIYEYRCASCGRAVEVIHSIHGTGPEACEVCGGAMRKALTTPAIVFKGSGWAKKDARSASKPAATASKDGSAEGASSGPSDGAAPASSPDTGTKDAAAPASSSATSGTSGTSTTASSPSSSGAARSGSGDRSA